MDDFSTIDEFRRILDADAEAGRTRPLIDYVSRCPELAERIRELYELRVGSAPTEAAALANGEEFVGRSLAGGRYALRRFLGSGGQAGVYLAEDRELGRKVAIKIFSRHGLVSPRQRERIRREGLIASRLDHPGICAVHDAGEEQGLSYLVMRYVEGWPLSSLIRRRLGDADGKSANLFRPCLDEPEGSGSSSGAERRRHETDETRMILGVIVKVARALHAAHEVGIVHRDVKPGNVMIGRDLEPVMLDFGMARDDELDAQTLTLSGEVFGTPSYMAPEQISGRRGAIDRRCDVHALGVTLYECLTLRRPFVAPTREQLFQQILVQEPTDPRLHAPEISRDLRIVLQTAMAKEPNRRYQTALDLAEELERILRGEPILARPPGLIGRFRRWFARNPALAGATSAAILVLVLATLVSLHLADEARAQKDRADARSRDYERLADARRLQVLLDERRGLHPARPEGRTALVAWLGRAEALIAGLPEHEAARRRLLVRATGRREPPGSGEDAERIVAEKDTEQLRGAGPVFAATEDGWHWEQLEELIAGLRRLRDQDRPQIVRALDRLDEFARQGRADAELWTALERRLENSDIYRGLRLRPQFGLVPIGPNETGYEQFRHLASAQPDTGGPAEFAGEPGLVLILLPGGHDLELGSPADERGRRQDELRHRVDLEPFLIAGHELSQGQWQAVMGGNPAGDRQRRAGEMRPVESLSLRDAEDFLRVADLRLPSEDEWEYAGRGGSNSAFWWGDDAREAERFALVGDAELGRESLERSHRSVLAGAANPFGLLGLHGNVAEWCRDAYPDPSRGLRVYRDGNFLMPAVFGRSAARHKADPDLRVKTLGLRPARSIDR
ncbi:MAG: SUMF1/EgtB/PvdO family nonheme iron enzyme [Planctomycetes bacterium]|nr:SUMF1/EgtB/PvdO family nonheme iron enzyme [Planctomycetota bacterium]